jgi:hypothetical protein
VLAGAGFCVPSSVNGKPAFKNSLTKKS